MTEYIQPEIPELAKVPLPELPAETAERALTQVAQAFIRKNPYMQYDFGRLTVECKGSPAQRRTNGQSPEQTAWDSEHYSQCSSFGYDLWLEAAGLELPGARTGYEDRLYEDEYWPAVITGYDPVGPGKDRGLTDREAALRILREQARPGDIVVGRTSYFSGHVMMIAGDVRQDGTFCLVHSWPVRGAQTYDRQTGVQGDEPDGSCTVQTVEEVLLDDRSSPNWCLLDDRRGLRWWLIRPSRTRRAQSVTLRPATVTRLQFPWMDIVKAPDRSVYASVQQGETVTVTETVRNGGTEDYHGLRILEYLPEGAEPVCTDGWTLRGNTLCRTLDLPAGQSAEMRYSVRCLLPMGQELVFPGGYVGAIPSRRFTLRVGGKPLTESQRAALDAAAGGALPETLRQPGSGMDWLNRFYRELLGTEIGLPETAAEYLNGQFRTVRPPTAEKPMLEVRENAPFSAMTVAKHLGGQWVYCPDITARTVAIREAYLTPGDVIVAADGEPAAAEDGSFVMTGTEEYLVVLGQGRAVRYTASEGAQLTSFSRTAERMLIRSVFAVLRPTQGREDLSAEVTPPQLRSTAVRSAEELGTAPGEVLRLTEDLTLAGDVSLRGRTLIVPEQVTLRLNGCTAEAGTLSPGGRILGPGRLFCTAETEDAAAPLLRACEGMPVTVRCVCPDSEITAFFDCACRSASWEPVESGTAKRKNLECILRTVPDGWTVKLPCSLRTVAVQTVQARGVTVDLCGASFFAPCFRGEDFSVTDSVGGGVFGFRGDEHGGAQEQNSSVSAPGIPVAVGCSRFSAALTVNGTLLCGSLTLKNGSSVQTGLFGRIKETESENA